MTKRKGCRVSGAQLVRLSVEAATSPTAQTAACAAPYILLWKITTDDDQITTHDDRITTHNDQITTRHDQITTNNDQNY